MQTLLAKYRPYNSPTLQIMEFLTGGTIDELGFHNANAIVDHMMTRLQVDEDERATTATQHATTLASANQANTTMESQMQTLLAQF